MKIVPLFATPVYTMMVPDHATLNAGLRSTILKQRLETDSMKISNLGGWQSPKDMLLWGGEHAAALVRHAIGLSSRVTKLPEGEKAGTLWRPELWANVNEAGHANQSHWHPGSYLSLVYYVDDGYAGEADRSLGGELVFIDPRMPYLRMRTPELRHASVEQKAEEQETWLRPRSGLLVAFPSYLAHAVRPYAGRGSRISIAINMVVAGSGT